MSFVMTFSAVEIIQRRVEGKIHAREELSWWIQQYIEGKIPDYQMAAWLMATVFRPLSDPETAILTDCMVTSGQELVWDPAIYPSLVDKHSTGGVGDKISLILAPLVAHMGVQVPMMAGRGLGHTGGTIDKLESIPGFRCDLTVPEFQEVVRKVGCCITAATPNMCAADKKLYALRDVTATVASPPLQTASIMCKKIAERPHSLVLDVKYGRGSFQATRDIAEALAQRMIQTGQANGLLPTVAFLTRMGEPIGCTIGNWLEVLECTELMRGNLASQPLSRDLVALVCLQGAQMVHQSSKSNDRSFDDLVKECYDALDNGKVLGVFRRMVEAQGGQVSVVDEAENVELSERGAYLAPSDGYIHEIDALLLGQLAVRLGAGRAKAEDAVDPFAGIRLLVSVGQQVKTGDKLASVFASDADKYDGDVLSMLEQAIRIELTPPDPSPPIVSHRVTMDGTEEIEMPSFLI